MLTFVIYKMLVNFCNSTELLHCNSVRIEYTGLCEVTFFHEVQRPGEQSTMLLL